MPEMYKLNIGDYCWDLSDRNDWYHSFEDPTVLAEDEFLGMYVRLVKHQTCVSDLLKSMFGRI